MPPKQPCTFYKSRGECRNGAQCRFSHDDTESSSPSTRSPCSTFAFFGKCGYSSCFYQHVSLKDIQVSPTPVETTQQFNNKVYYAVDPSNARVLDDAFCVDITKGEDGKPSKATVEICLINPHRSLSSLPSMDFDELINRSASRGCDGGSRKMLLDSEGKRIGDQVGFSEAEKRSAIRLTLTFKFVGENLVHEDSQFDLQRAFDLEDIVVCRRSYITVEKDPVSNAVLDVCFKIVDGYFRDHIIGTDHETAGRTTRDIFTLGSLNGLQKSMLNVANGPSTTVTMKLSTKFCKGSVVVSGLKRMFNDYATKYLAQQNLPVKVVAVHSMSPLTPEIIPSASVLDAWTFGLAASVESGVSNKRCEYMDSSTAVPEGYWVPFSPALREFHALYNSVLLARVIDGSQTVGDAPLMPPLEATTAALNASDRQDADKIQAVWEAFVRDGHHRCFTMKQRDGHPEYRNPSRGAFHDVAFQMHVDRTVNDADGKESVVCFRFANINAKVTLYIVPKKSGPSKLTLQSMSNPSLERTFTLESVNDNGAKDNGVSQLDIQLDTLKATWYRRLENEEANLIAAVSFSAVSFSAVSLSSKPEVGDRLPRLDGMPGERCRNRELCMNAKCCRAHVADMILTEFPASLELEVYA